MRSRECGGKRRPIRDFSTQASHQSIAKMAANTADFICSVIKDRDFAERRLAEGKVLAANSLAVEERSPGGDCGDW